MKLYQDQLNRTNHLQERFIVQKYYHVFKCQPCFLTKSHFMPWFSFQHCFHCPPPHFFFSYCPSFFLPHFSSLSHSSPSPRPRSFPYQGIASPLQLHGRPAFDERVKPELELDRRFFEDYFLGHNRFLSSDVRFIALSLYNRFFNYPFPSIIDSD